MYNKLEIGRIEYMLIMLLRLSGSVVVDSLFIVAPIVSWHFMFGLCFFM